MNQHKLTALILGGAMVAGATLGLIAEKAGATKPIDGDHKVTLCHATPPDTAANGWHSITVDIASSGYPQGGHAEQHDADIIPPYTYGDFSYPGKNWDDAGQAVYNNGCVAPTPPPTTQPPGCESDCEPPPTTEPPVTPPVTTPPVTPPVVTPPVVTPDAPVLGAPVPPVVVAVPAPATPVVVTPLTAG